MILNIYLRAGYCGTIGRSRGIGCCNRIWIWRGVRWRLLLSCSDWWVKSIKILLCLGLHWFLVSKICAWFPPFCQFPWLHICVLIFCACNFWMSGWFLIHMTNSNIFLLSPVPIVSSFSRATTSFVFNLTSWFLRVAFTAVRVAMVCLSPVVALTRLAIKSSASFYFELTLLLWPWCCLPGIWMFLMHIGIIRGLDGKW